MKAVEEVALAGHHAIMVIKTNHARCPKAWLESKMSEFPGGTWIILEGRTKNKSIYYTWAINTTSKLYSPSYFPKDLALLLQDNHTKRVFPIYSEIFTSAML